MGYLVVKEETETRLHFTRQPGINSWGMLVGFSAFGIGITYYGNDPVYMKMIYLVLAVVLGLSCLDDWEECDFNKETGEIHLKKNSIWDFITNKQQEVIVVAIDDVAEAGITEEKVAFFGKTYQVVLQLSHGASVGLTESFTFGSSSEHEEVAEKVRQFLRLDERTSGNDYVDSSSTEDEDAGEDFEQIDKSELLNECDESGAPLPNEEPKQESCEAKAE